MKNRVLSTMLVGTALASALVLGGCGSASTGTTQETAAAASTEAATEDSTEAAADAETAEDVTTILCATEGHTTKMEYLDENGELTGYEVELIHAIDDRLPQYEFEIEVTEFESIFTGMDSGRYQLGFNSLSWNETRAEKYIFPKHYIRYENSGLYVRDGLLAEHPIESVDDLGGLKTVSNAKGDAWQLFLENYNEAHPDNPIEIEYSDGDWASFYLRLYQGDFDFMMGSESTLQVYQDEYGYNFEFVELPEEEANSLQNPSNWIIVANYDGGQELADAIDGALEELQADGTLAELSIKYWGKDFSGSDREDW